MSPTAFPACPEHGHVTFLGAGPGDPGLLTLRAVEALAHADVLVAEHEVLDVVRTHARQGVTEVHTDADASADAPAQPGPGAGVPRLAVVDGSSTTTGTPAVRDAAHLVMEAARGGRRVVRAVTGDPGLDTYAAEEMLACAAAGVPFEVVPGIATAVGVPAYAGVPLRDAEGTDVRFVDARTASDRCWTEVGASDGTVVVSTTLDSVAAAAGRVAVLHLAVEEIRHGLEAAVRVVGRADRFTGAVFDGAHLVEHEERVGLGQIRVRLRERPVYREPAALERLLGRHDRPDGPGRAAGIVEHGENIQVRRCECRHVASNTCARKYYSAALGSPNCNCSTTLGSKA